MSEVKFNNYTPSFIEAVEDFLRSGQSAADLRIAAAKASTGATGATKRDAATRLQKLMSAFIGEIQQDPGIIDDFIKFQRSKLVDAGASGESRVPAREALKNLRDIQALLTEQRQFPKSGEAPEGKDELIARLESPEMEAKREEILAGVKPDPAAEFTKAVSADNYYNADKRMAEKRREFTSATGIEVDDDEDFIVDPPESDAQVAERIKADKMLAETKAAGKEMKAEREAARKAAASAAKTTAETPAETPAEKPTPKQLPRTTAKDRMLAGIKEGSPTALEDPTGEEYDTAFDQDLPEGMEDAVSSAEVPTASPQPSSSSLEELFKDAHGGPFDPKSKTDLRKMGEIKQLLAEQGGQGNMTNNQFALKLYRRFDYV